MKPTYYTYQQLIEKMNRCATILNRCFRDHDNKCRAKSDPEYPELCACGVTIFNTSIYAALKELSFEPPMTHSANVVNISSSEQEQRSSFSQVSPGIGNRKNDV